MGERKLVIDHLKFSYEGLFNVSEFYALISSWFSTVERRAPVFKSLSISAKNETTSPSFFLLIRLAQGSKDFAVYGETPVSFAIF